MPQALVDALRFLRRRPAFCSGVVSIMAMSIGACTAIFSIVTAVLFAPWPYSDPDRLAIIWHAQGTAAGVVGMGPSDYAAYRDTTRAFESVAAISTGGYNLGREGAEPARVTCGRMTPGMFPMLGVNASRGRWFTDDEDRNGSRTIVISHRLWRSQFGGDETLPGQRIVLDAMPYTVAGIMPPSFRFPLPGIPGTTEAECWIPASFTPVEMVMPAFNQIVVVKRKPEVTFDHAAEDAAAGAQGIWESYPPAVKSQVQLRARLVPLVDQITAGTRAPLLMFTGSALLLLLIGCANVSNLMLTRLQIRRREMTLRAALGATRSVLVKQLLAESVMLAVAGSAAGILLAKGIMVLMLRLSPGNVPRLENAAIDMWTLAFVVMCAVLAGLAGGMAPALRSRAMAEGGAGASGERTASLGLRRDRLRSALVILEIAMAVVVLTGAALLARSVGSLNRVDAGFDPMGVLTFSVALPEAAYPQAEQIETFSHTVVERLRQVPTVETAAAGSSLPIGRADVAVVSLTDAVPGSPPYRPAAAAVVTPGYHSASGIPLRAGRLFLPSDTKAAQPVAIVNETMAKYWPDGNAVGRTMQQLGQSRPFTIVGVAADVRQAGLDRAPAPAFHVPMAQSSQPVRRMAFVIRSSGNPLRVAPHVRRIVAEADRTLPIFGLGTGDDLVSPSLAPRRFNLLIVSVFAAVALGLAVMGLYAVMSYTVSQSAKEFGIRVAIGATGSSIVRLVLGRALRLLLAGLVVGITAAAGLTRLVSSLLFGVEPLDPTAFLSVAALLLCVGGISVAIPAIRAGRVDPITCLRSE